MQRPYEVVSQLLNGMTQIKREWYTSEDELSPFPSRIIKDQKRLRERQKHGKNMTQWDIFAKNVMGIGMKSVNDGVIGGSNVEETHFKVLPNDEVNLIDNKVGGYHSNYPRPGEIRVGIEMRDGETVMETGVTITPLERKERVKNKGTSHFMSNKIPRSLKIPLRTCSHLFSTKMKGRTKC